MKNNQNRSRWGNTRLKYPVRVPEQIPDPNFGKINELILRSEILCNSNGDFILNFSEIPNAILCQRNMEFAVNKAFEFWKEKFKGDPWNKMFHLWKPYYWEISTRRGGKKKTKRRRRKRKKTKRKNKRKKKTKRQRRKRKKTRRRR